MRLLQPVLTKGECTLLQWKVEQVDRVVIGFDEVPLEGERRICPGHSRSIKFTIWPPSGRKIERFVVVTVNTPGAPKYDFKADATTIQRGDCTRIRWSVPNASQVDLNGDKVALQGNQQICPQRSSTYQLTVVDKDGDEVSQWVTVTVTP